MDERCSEREAVLVVQQKGRVDVFAERRWFIDFVEDTSGVDSRIYIKKCFDNYPSNSTFNKKWVSEKIKG